VIGDGNNQIVGDFFELLKEFFKTGFDLLKILSEKGLFR